MPRKTPLALIILDGFGYASEREGNAIALAQMPFYNELLEKYPHTLLQASGECVGLPKGVMGNSNVGHLCMGAGRIVRTDVERIDHEITTGSFFHNLALSAGIERNAPTNYWSTVKANAPAIRMPQSRRVTNAVSPMNSSSRLC